MTPYASMKEVTRIEQPFIYSLPYYYLTFVVQPASSRVAQSQKDMANDILGKDMLHTS